MALLMVNELVLHDYFECRENSSRLALTSLDCNSKSTLNHAERRISTSTSQKVPTPDTLPISWTYSDPSAVDVLTLLAFRFFSLVRLSRNT